MEAMRRGGVAGGTGVVQGSDLKSRSKLEVKHKATDLRHSIKSSETWCERRFRTAGSAGAVGLIRPLMSPSLLFPFQECPSGLVDEETFKTIYSQFFPQGGKKKKKKGPRFF